MFTSRSACSVVLAAVAMVVPGCAAEGDSTPVGDEASETSSAAIIGQTGPQVVREDIILEAKILSYLGNDPRIDPETFTPPLSTSPLPYVGCRNTLNGPLCWGSEDFETIDEIGQCADGRSVYEAYRLTSFFARQHNKQKQVWYRATKYNYPYAKLTFNADGSGKHLDDKVEFYTQRIHPQAGNTDTFVITQKGTVDFVKSKGKTVFADQGLIQFDQDDNILVQKGTWDAYDDYDGTIARICGALDAL